MTTITILSKEPPGGRCSLYMRYAEALRQALGFQPEVRYCDSSAAVPPPAMLVGDVLVTPSDGVIVSPEDIALSLSDRLGEAKVAELRHVLEAEWRSGAMPEGQRLATLCIHAGESP